MKVQQFDPEGTLAPGFAALHDDYGIDSDLLDILRKVNVVTQEMSAINPPKSKAIPLRLRKRIRSVQYSLLSGEDYDMSGSENPVLKACRLGVLLYVGAIQNEFQVSPISKQFILQLKFCLQKEHFNTNSTRALRLWIIFLTGSLVLDPTEKPWLVRSIIEAVSQLSLPSWDDVKLLLKNFAWAETIQNISSRDLWNEAVKIQNLLQR